MSESDLADGDRGEDGAKLRSIELTPFDAGSGCGLSAISAGDNSAAGSSANRQLWLKAATIAAARIGHSMTVATLAFYTRVPNVGSTTTAGRGSSIAGGISAGSSIYPFHALEAGASPLQYLQHCCLGVCSLL
jgi:hypothetical protein